MEHEFSGVAEIDDEIQEDVEDAIVIDEDEETASNPEENGEIDWDNVEVVDEIEENEHQCEVLSPSANEICLREYNAANCDLQQISDDETDEIQEVLPINVQVLQINEDSSKSEIQNEDITSPEQLPPISSVPDFVATTDERSKLILDDVKSNEDENVNLGYSGFIEAADLLNGIEEETKVEQLEPETFVSIEQRPPEIVVQETTPADEITDIEMDSDFLEIAVRDDLESNEDVDREKTPVVAFESNDAGNLDDTMGTDVQDEATIAPVREGIEFSSANEMNAEVAFYVDSLAHLTFDWKKYTCFYCIPCQVYTTQTNSWEDHISDANHKKNIYRWKMSHELVLHPETLENSVKSQAEIDKYPEFVAGAEFVIEICGDNGEPKHFICQLCNSVCNTLDYLKSHLSSFAHLDNYMEKYEPAIYRPPGSHIKCDESTNIRRPTDKVKRYITDEAKKYAKRKGRGKIKAYRGALYRDCWVEGSQDEEMLELEENLLAEQVAQFLSDFQYYNIKSELKSPKASVANAEYEKMEQKTKNNYIGLQYLMEIWAPSRRAVPVWYCILCDSLFTNWSKHCEVVQHMAAYLKKHYKKHVFDCAVLEAKDEEEVRNNLSIAKTNVLQLEGYSARVRSVVQVCKLEAFDSFVPINILIAKQLVEHYKINIGPPPRAEKKPSTEIPKPKLNSVRHFTSRLKEGGKSNVYGKESYGSSKSKTVSSSPRKPPPRTATSTAKKVATMSSNGQQKSPRQLVTKSPKDQSVKLLQSNEKRKEAAVVASKSSGDVSRTKENQANSSKSVNVTPGGNIVVKMTQNVPKTKNGDVANAVVKKAQVTTFQHQIKKIVKNETKVVPIKPTIVAKPSQVKANIQPQSAPNIGSKQRLPVASPQKPVSKLAPVVRKSDYSVPKRKESVEVRQVRKRSRSTSWRRRSSSGSKRHRRDSTPRRHQPESHSRRRTRSPTPRRRRPSTSKRSSSRHRSRSRSASRRRPRISSPHEYNSRKPSIRSHDELAKRHEQSRSRGEAHQHETRRVVEHFHRSNETRRFSPPAYQRRMDEAQPKRNMDMAPQQQQAIVPEEPVVYLSNESLLRLTDLLKIVGVDLGRQINMGDLDGLRMQMGPVLFDRCLATILSQPSIANVPPPPILPQNNDERYMGPQEVYAVRQQHPLDSNERRGRGMHEVVDYHHRRRSRSGSLDRKRNREEVGRQRDIDGFQNVQQVPLHQAHRYPNHTTFGIVMRSVEDPSSALYSQQRQQSNIIAPNFNLGTRPPTSSIYNNADPNSSTTHNSYNYDVRFGYRGETASAANLAVGGGFPRQPNMSRRW